MRPSIIALIIVLAVGSIIVSLGFLTNQEISEVSKIPNQYEQARSIR